MGILLSETYCGRIDSVLRCVERLCAGVVGQSGRGGISAESIGKTISGATFSGAGNDLVVDTFASYKPTQPGSGRRGREGLPAERRRSGQNGSVDNGSIPVPESFKSRLSASIDAIS